MARRQKPSYSGRLLGFLLLAGLVTLVVGLVVTFPCLQPPSGEIPELDLTVATWNLRWFPSGRPEPQSRTAERRTIEVAARQVRQVEPHILCVQEVRDRAVAEALARASKLQGLRVVACTSFPVPEGGVGSQQTAILSNLPVLESRTERWHSRGLIDPPRGYAYALLQAPCGPVAVFSIHLKSNYIPEGEDSERQSVLNRLKRELAASQIRTLADRLSRRGSDGVQRVIVAGDFNTSLYDDRWAGEETLRGLVKADFTTCYDGLSERRRGASLPGNGYYPPVTFDYILLRGFPAWRDTRVHRSGWVSDHRLVSVRLAAPGVGSTTSGSAGR